MRPARKRRESGSAIIEFTLVLLPLLGFMLLTMDVAWMFFAWASLQEGVREGVRFAVTGQLLSGYTGQDASIRAVVQQYSFGFIPAANAAADIDIQYYTPTTLTAVSGLNSNTGGNVVKVTVTGVTIRSFGPIWRAGGPMSLAASSSDVMEGSPGGIPPPR